MEIKDWLLLFVPIVVNGAIVFIFQKIVATKLERLNKKQSLKDEAILLFWRKLQGLNTVLIKTNVSVRENPDSLNAGLTEIHNNMFDIVEYFDTNVYDLDAFKGEFDCLNAAWNDFVVTLQSLQNTTLSPQNQLILGQKLQAVKDNNSRLVSCVRKKY